MTLIYFLLLIFGSEMLVHLLCYETTRFVTILVKFDFNLHSNENQTEFAYCAVATVAGQIRGFVYLLFKRSSFHIFGGR